ncbi:MAG: DUF4956 domain-containing protein [Planctomycetota bacterium]
MEFLEVPLFDDDIYKLIVRFGINLASLALIVVFAINPRRREREFAFTAIMLNVVVFFICFTMKKLELDLGLALGLFAVFGVLRYRTEALSAKQMTYLFIIIGIAVINSLSNKKTSYAEVVLANAVVFLAAFLNERILSRIPSKSKIGGPKPDTPPKSVESQKLSVEYDRIELLRIENRDELLDDLRQRTGLQVSSVQIKSIDMVQNRASLTLRTSPLKSTDDIHLSENEK